MPVSAGRLVKRVEELLGEGKRWEEIARVVRSEFMLDLKPEELERIYQYAKAQRNANSEGAPAGGFAYPDSVRVGRLEDEVMEIYRVVKSRLYALRRLESEIGAPLPETDRALAIAVNVLKLLGELSSEKRETQPYVEVIERVLSDVEAGGEDGEATEGDSGGG